MPVCFSAQRVNKPNTRHSPSYFKLKMNAFTSANSWGFRMRFIGGMGLIGVAV